MKKFIPALCLIILFSLCFQVLAAEDKKAVIKIADEDLPATIAVLPFQNDTKDPFIAGQVRRSMANFLSSKAYQDIKLPLVDEKLVQMERSTGKIALDLKPDEICKAIGCDGLLYGRIIDYQKIYAALYSQLGVEVEIWMVNTKTGKELFRVKDAVRYHEGGVPLTPIGLIMTAISTAMNIREIQQVRMVNELCYKFNERIPSPKVMAGRERPVIREVLTNVKEGPFGKGKIIRVGLEGDPGLVATFDIGNFKKGILMKETKPGIYMGEYLVLPGDNSVDMPVVASLTRPGGYASEWIDVSGFVTIDTTPPPPVNGLRARGFQDRIEIRWEGLKNIPDLAGYKILRSEQPLSGFSELTKIEFNEFDDKAAKPDTLYYYRVVGFDRVGNESDTVDPAKASLLSKEPVVLSGDIRKDMILSGVYIVRDSVTVPKGISLSLGPETRIMFGDNSSMHINGRLTAMAKDAPVEFVPSGEGRWHGVLVQGGSIALNGFKIKGAATALSLENSEGTLENGIITECGTGLIITGTPATSVKNCTLSSNKTGLELRKTDAGITACNIFQNEKGIVMKGFSGVLADNNIIDNSENLWSEAPVKIGANYFGSIKIEETGTKNAVFAKVYNMRFPDGKIVDAVADLFALLTAEERKEKATGFMIEAGSYFRQRNYGKASSLFESAVQASPTAESYYYLAICYQEMKDDEKSMKYLEDGVKKFPNDTTLQKAVGFMYYQKGNEAEAKKAFEEVLRLSPEDRQVKFLLERMGK
jgi:hypothetical protein